MKHFKYPSIAQFRNVVKEVEHSRNTFNEDGTHTFNSAPKITFTGTVKLHGTNAAIVYDKGEIYAQSRSRVITPEDDNLGFAQWVADNEESLRTLLMPVCGVGSWWEDDIMVLYGEWVGPGVQKSVGINKLDERKFVMFGCKLIHGEESSWLDAYWYFNSTEQDIFLNVEDFQTYEITIDFNDPTRAVSLLQELTKSVEEECPIAKALINTEEPLIGEGIVWSAVYNGNTLRFKVKGEKHSPSKVKVLADVDVEKLNSIQEFVTYAVTDNRLTQMAQESLPAVAGSPDFDRKFLGKFIKAVSTDVVKEESDVLEGNGLTMKDVGSSLSKAAKQWFFEHE